MRFKVTGNCPWPHGTALPEVMTLGLVDGETQRLSLLVSSWEKPEDTAQLLAGLPEASVTTFLQPVCIPSRAASGPSSLKSSASLLVCQLDRSLPKVMR